MLAHSLYTCVNKACSSLRTAQQNAVKSMCRDELARELISVLCTEYGISQGLLLGAMRVRAAVNGVAMRTLQVVYPNVLNVGCFSHTIDYMGQRFSTPTLDKFMSAWLNMFSHSAKARLAWKSHTDRAMASCNNTRWWSKWEIIHQILVQFGDVEGFLDENGTDISPANTAKLLSRIHSKQQLFKLS